MITNQTVFQILDLDRTLLDTSKLAHRLRKIIARHSPELAKDINVEILKHARNRTSFFIFEYVAERVGEDILQDYIHELHTIAPVDDLLLPGAIERIAFAKSQPGWGVGILTFGSRRDQRIKLQLVGLQMERHLITDSPKKSDLLISWKRPDGRFQLPIEFGGHVVDIVTLDDDKLVAFMGMPEGTHGQWVADASIGGTIELQHLPLNVKVVRNLTESIEYLQSKLLARE